MRLSLLELSVVAPSKTRHDAFLHAVELAQRAEEWGCSRIWIAEHHGGGSGAGGGDRGAGGGDVVNQGGLGVGAAESLRRAQGCGGLLHLDRALPGADRLRRGAGCGMSSRGSSTSRGRRGSCKVTMVTLCPGVALSHWGRARGETWPGPGRAPGCDPLGSCGLCGGGGGGAAADCAGTCPLSEPGARGPEFATSGPRYGGRPAGWPAADREVSAREWGAAAVHRGDAGSGGSAAQGVVGGSRGGGGHHPGPDDRS